MWLPVHGSGSWRNQVGEPVGLLGERRRDRVQELVARGAGGRAEPEPVRDLRLADEEQAPRLVGGESGEVRLEAVDQLDPATRAARREDRHAGLAERLDVAQDRALGDLERLGELPCRHPAAALQDQQHVEHPGRAHRRKSTESANMTVDVRFGMAGCPA